MGFLIFEAFVTMIVTFITTACAVTCRNLLPTALLPAWRKPLLFFLKAERTGSITELAGDDGAPWLIDQGLDMKMDGQ